MLQLTRLEIFMLLIKIIIEYKCFQIVEPIYIPLAQERKVMPLDLLICHLEYV
jgi:hypothetical protein